MPEKYPVTQKKVNHSLFIARQHALYRAGKSQLDILRHFCLVSLSNAGCCPQVSVKFCM